MGKSNLEIALEWIYAHVVTPAGALRHRLEPLRTIAGADIFVGYTQLVFQYEGREFKARAEELMAAPDHAHWVLRDLNTNLGVPIIAEFFQFPGKPPQTVNPVGDYWPEKSDELGKPIYRTGSEAIQTIYEGMPWTDARGLFYAEKARKWYFAPYWYWVKQNA